MLSSHVSVSSKGQVVDRESLRYARLLRIRQLLSFSRMRRRLETGNAPLPRQVSHIMPSQLNETSVDRNVLKTAQGSTRTGPARSKSEKPRTPNGARSRQTPILRPADRRVIQSSGHERHKGSTTRVRTNAGLAREARVRADPLADVQSPASVRCRRCSQEVKLSQRTYFDLAHWYQHRGRCPGSVSPSRETKTSRDTPQQLEAHEPRAFKDDTNRGFIKVCINSIHESKQLQTQYNRIDEQLS